MKEYLDEDFGVSIDKPIKRFKKPSRLLAWVEYAVKDTVELTKETVMAFLLVLPISIIMAIVWELMKWGAK